MDALKKINWKQPKYMIPLIIYFPLLFVGYFVIDLFHTEKAEIPDGLTTTEYLNPDLPDAKMKETVLVTSTRVCSNHTVR